MLRLQGAATHYLEHELRRKHQWNVRKPKMWFGGRLDCLRQMSRKLDNGGFKCCDTWRCLVRNFGASGCK